MATNNSVPNPKKKIRLGYYPWFSVIFTIFLALMNIGVFGLLLISGNSLSKQVLENVEIQVYLDKLVTDSERIKIQRTLSTKAYIATQDGTPRVSFVSKEQAAREFVASTGEEFAELLGENPLRDLLTLNIKQGYLADSAMTAIQAEITAMPGVFEVVYIKDLSRQITANIGKISLVLSGIGLILLLTALILINNTMKLALFSQRFLIRSMQLVGAKSGFIQQPFLRRATLHGILAGLLAGAALYGLLQLAYNYVPELKSLENLEYMAILLGILLVFGALVGFFATFRSIRKYLRMPLDKLY